MKFFYGDKNLLRMLDEADFWKLQESEHTVVIREITPDLEKVYVDKLKEWQEAFSQTRGVVIRYIETVVRAGEAIDQTLEKQIVELIKFCIDQSQQFINFLNMLAAESSAVNSNTIALSVVAHIRRESEYFIGIAQTILY